MIARKKIIFLLFPITLICLFHCKNKSIANSIIPLNQGWKVKLGDNMLWSTSAYNDSLWDSVMVAQNTGPEIFEKYDGFAWYRIKIFIPSSLKQYAHVNDSVKFFLGIIDDCDQVYLNGHILGQNAVTISNGIAGNENFINVMNLWSVDRKYIISVKDDRILWDTVNVIAIRVFDQLGIGGLLGKMPYISLEDLVTFDFSKFYTVINPDSIDKCFLVKNISSRFVYSGNFSITAKRNDSESILFSWDSLVRISPGESTLISVSLPVSTDPLNVCVKFRDNRTNLVAIDSVEVPYALSK